MNYQNGETMPYYGRPEPKYPFSAIVYKEGNAIIAEDMYGKTIAEGEAGIDDAEVIQSALDVGGKIHICKENYYINDTLIFNDGQIIEGEGWSYSEPYTISGTVFHLTKEIDTRYKKDIILSNIALLGNKTNNGIIVGSNGESYNYQFIKLAFINFNNAIYSDPNLTGLYDSYFENIIFAYNNCGFVINENMNTFNRCSFRMNSTAVSFYNTYNANFISSVFSGNNTNIKFYNHWGKLNFYGCWFELGRTDISYSNMFYSKITNAFTKGIHFNQCYINDTIISISSLYPTHQKNISLNNVWFQNLNKTDLSTYIPELTNMEIINTYAIDNTGSIYNILLKNHGTAYITGDGSTTTFTIPHGLVSTPNYINVIPKGSAPKPDSIDADATNITLTFSTAPASGTYYYYWEAKI